MNNIYVLNKNYRQIGVLSNQGANPQAPYYDDLYVQELDTGADTYQFSTMSTSYTQDLLEIGNHIMFTYNNRNELFTITSLEYSHYEGYKTISVYAEGIGFELLDVFMERPPIQKYPGNDSDGDGDDNTDDEYADVDDMYLDENGIIIYDKDGSGPPKEEDMYVDGNGIIVYKPNKRNKKNDSLEFKNISYPIFLNILLKNSGWSFTCQPGLNSIKHNISVKYDTNIYAILQDSMQAFRGVELEFVHEMQNGRVKKVVKAYKDGGRGSFVGKRFEYGTNVRGITKTQEVTNNEDDTIIRIDNVGVDVYYDIDFALKSAEIPEIEIGDTHYVIDRQFHPPMTIKARIGKIEVSFSDPTKNKITVANNKKIRGSAIEDEFDEDDIKDIIDDYDSIIDDGIVDDGTGDDGTGDDGTGDDGTGDDTNIPDIDVEELSTIELHSALLTVPLDETSSGTALVDDQNTSLYPALSLGKKQVLEFLMNDIEVCRYTHEDVVGKYWRAGIKDYPIYLDIKPNIEFSNNPLYFHRDKNSDGYDRWSDCEWRSDVASAIVIKDTEDINGDGDEIDEGEHMTHSYNLPSLVAAVIAAFQYHIDYHPNGGTDDGGDSGEDDGGSSSPGYDNNPVFETVTAVLLMKSEEMETNTLDVNTIQFSDGTTMTTAGSGSDVDLSDYATIQYVDDAIAGLGDSGSGGSDLGIPDGVIEYSYEDELNKHKLTIAADVQVNNLDVGNVLSTSKLSTDTVDTTEIKFADGTTMTTASGSNRNGYAYKYLLNENHKNKEFNIDTYKEAYVSVGGGYSVDFGSIGLHAGRTSYYTSSEVPIYAYLAYNASTFRPSFAPSSGRVTGVIDLGRPESNLYARWRTIYAVNALNTSDIKYKENVIYLDELLDTQTYSLEPTEPETPFLDFIKNDFKPALYNYKPTSLNESIRQEDNQLGFIANDIIDTEIGGTFLYDFGEDGEQDIMVSTNGYITVVARALQEEVRMRDEKIASLEARLAAIEEMLNNR